MYEGRHRVTGQARAIKAIPKHRVRDPKTFMQEINILRRLDHPNIVKLFEVFDETAYIYLVLELCTGGELFDRIVRLGHFGEQEAQAIFTDIMYALAYCHERGVVHRDVKPENFIYLSRDLPTPLKVIDFGLSYQLTSRSQVMTSVVGTSYYIAPEVLEGCYTAGCDVWSAGVVLYILLTGKPPFDGDKDSEIIEKVRKGHYDFKIPEFKLITKDAKDLISRMLVKNTAKRLTSAQVLEHPWVRRQINCCDLTVNYGRLRSFADSNRLKKIVLTYIATQLG